MAASTAVAAVIGLVPAVFVATPAYAAAGDITMEVTELEGTEGDNLVFQIRRENDGTGLPEVTVDVNTAAGTATSDTDYTAVSTQLTFAAVANGVTGDQLKQITVNTTDDALDEATESFTLTVSNLPGGASDLVGTGLIGDDDATPTFSLSTDSSVAEDVGNAVVTATLSAVSGRDVTIPVESVDDTATAGQDYTALGGAEVITIVAGETTGTVDVPILDDVLDEADTQALTVQQGGGGVLTNATAGSPTSVTVTIEDNDDLPVVTIAGAGAATEGNNLNFPVTLSAISERDVTVTVDTADGDTNGATAGSDYTAVDGGTVTFVAGDTSETLSVTTADDNVDEVSPEVVSVTASEPTNATLADPATVTGGIDDDETAPEATLSPLSVTEGDSGTSTATFTLTLDAASGQTATVDYEIGGGTATADTDYTDTSGTVTFAPGETEKTFPVTIVGDTIDEGAGETFEVTLSNTDGTVAAGGSIGTTAITITDDDDAPTFSVADVTKDEGDATNNATFTVTLSNASTAEIDFDVAIVDGTLVDVGAGVGSNDYNAPSATLTIPPLSTTGDITVTVNGDEVFEGNETATLNVSLVGGETDAQGPLDASTLTLTNDDDAPSIVLNTQSGSEGGFLSVIATVTGVSQAATVFDLTMAGDSSGSNNAAETSDYVDSGDQATIAAGTSSGSTLTFRTFLANNDTIDEPTEAVKVTAEDVAGNVATVSSIYKIGDDPGDTAPSVSLEDETIDEDLGSVDVGVVLNFDGDTTATERDMVVSYYTVNGSALAGKDYTAEDATITIDAGDTTGAINIPITDDELDEPDQNFSVKIDAISPDDDGIADDTGVVTILDNDDTVAPTITAPSGRVGAGAVTITGTAQEGAQVKLWMDPYADGDDFKVVAYATANSAGEYSFTRKISTGYNLYTQANGLTSPVKTIRVKQKPVLSGGSTGKRSVTVRVVGDPKGAGQTVRIQQADGDGTWSTIATGKTGANGMYQRRFTGLRSKSSVTLRAYVVGDADKGILSGLSSVKTIGVR